VKVTVFFWFYRGLSYRLAGCFFSAWLGGRGVGEMAGSSGGGGWYTVGEGGDICY